MEKEENLQRLSINQILKKPPQDAPRLPTQQPVQIKIPVQIQPEFVLPKKPDGALTPKTSSTTDTATKESGLSQVSSLDETRDRAKRFSQVFGSTLDTKGSQPTGSLSLSSSFESQPKYDDTEIQLDLGEQEGEQLDEEQQEDQGLEEGQEEQEEDQEIQEGFSKEAFPPSSSRSMPSGSMQSGSMSPSGSMPPSATTSTFGKLSAVSLPSPPIVPTRKMTLIPQGSKITTSCPRTSVPSPVPTPMLSPSLVKATTEKECPPCQIICDSVARKKTLSEEEKFLEKFTDFQLDRIGLDRNIPDVIVFPRHKKIQMILSDPMRLEFDYQQPLENMNIGDLLYVAGMEKLCVHRIPNRFNTRRVLVPLIQFARNAGDLICLNNLTDDDLRTIVYVLEFEKDVNYSWILLRRDLEMLIRSGVYPYCNEQFISRWRRYEILHVLPLPFIQSLSFQLPSAKLAMTPNEHYIVARLIDTPENPFEHLYAKTRICDPEFLKLKYGMVVPKTWNSMDYMALNGANFPMGQCVQECLLEKLISLSTKSTRKEYIAEFTDLEIFTEIKSFVPYNSRDELIDNVANLFDEFEKIYFISFVPCFEGRIFYGNYLKSEYYTPESLARKLDYFIVQDYPLEEKMEVCRVVRQLQTLLLARDMMTQGLAFSISRLITVYECIPEAQVLLFNFLMLSQEEIACVRKCLYQKYYYSQTRNCIYLPFEKSSFLDQIPVIFPPTTTLEELPQTVLLMKLFFGRIPHSIRNY